MTTKVLPIVVVVAVVGLARGGSSSADTPADNPLPAPTAVADPVPLPPRPTPVPDTTPLPISLPSALRLADASPLDIALAAERVRVATAQYNRARVLWLPNLNVGADYFRHDGQLQDIRGFVFPTSKSSFLVGGGPSLSFATADAFYAPLAARQVLAARQAGVQIARNDTTYAVAQAYFDVQQARGEVAGASDAVRRAEDLVRRAEELTPGLAPRVEVSRARAELARRRQHVERAYEQWQTAGAELSRILRLDQTAVVEPAEDPHVRVEVVDINVKPDDLIPIGLTHRPELAAQQAVVQATLARIKQEKLRPLVPSLILRGTGSATPGISSGYFGGGINDFVGDFNGRNSMDLQALWTFENLGLGNRAAVRERQAENRAAVLELFKTQDRVAAEVTAALAQAKRAAARVKEAEDEVRAAVDSADKNLQGLGQTKRIGEQLVLVFRPQEVVAAITALDQAYQDYYAAVADANRANFRLYRALGHPAQAITLPTPPTP